MRIPVTEDDPLLSHALCAVLRSSGHEADAVSSGEDAVDYLLSGSYDAATPDVPLPGRNGFEVLRTVRAAGNTTPILMLTARTEVSDRVYGPDLSTNDYLTKPFSYDELPARLRRMTQPITAPGSRLLCYGNVTPDRSTCELSTPFGSCRLTHREFRGPELLLPEPRHPISTEYLPERLRGTESGAESHSVWICISELRRRLRAHKADVCIRSSRNTGYSPERIR